MGIYRDGKAAPIAREPGPPPRIDGYIVGWTEIAPDAPPRHTGELHPDADEVLVVVSGLMEVVLEDEDGTQTTYDVGPGESIVVPRGTWHRTAAREPSVLLNITPGPHGEWRPLPQA